MEGKGALSECYFELDCPAEYSGKMDGLYRSTQLIKLG